MMSNSLNHRLPQMDSTFPHADCFTSHDDIDQRDDHHSSSLWRTYQRWVTKHHTHLWIMDELVSRLLVWTPFSSHSASSESKRWRQIGFGVLDLHRLLVEVALTTSSNDNHHQRQGSLVGTSIALPNDDENDQIFSFLPSTNNIRLGLTALQSVLPMVLELARPSSSSSSDDDDPASLATRRHARVRCYVERVRFVLRTILLVKYWRRIWHHYQKSNQQQCDLQMPHRHHHHLGNDSTNSNRCSDAAAAVVVLPGLMLRGGLYHAPAGIPLEQEHARLERNNYVGRRTGRRIGVSDAKHSLSKNGTDTHTRVFPTRTRDTVSLQWVRLVLGELLYILRPMVQAEGHAASMASTTIPKSNARRFTIWSWCLAMDLTSLACLRANTTFPTTASTTHTATTTTSTTVWSTLATLVRRFTYVQDDNPVTATELQRRQLRLLLYLLRSPVWERITERTVRTCTDTVARVPLVGGMVNHYIWDWIYYWQLYRAEEG